MPDSFFLSPISDLGLSNALTFNREHLTYNGQRLSYLNINARALKVFTELVQVQTASSGTVEATVKDANFLNSTTATLRQDLQIQAVAIPPTIPISFESLDPLIATVNSLTGYVTSQGTGSVAILVKNGSLEKQINHSAGSVGGQTSSVFQSYVEDSLADVLNVEMDAIVGVGGSLQLFSSKDNTTLTYARNGSFWIDADLTCWPVWNSSAGNRFSGCLISPRHMVLAKHCGISNGTTMRFVTAANEVVVRTVSNRINVGTFDLQIAVLDSDVPSSISFAKVLPEDWSDYLTFADLPVLCGNQFTELVLREAYQSNLNGASRAFVHRTETETEKLPFTKTIISGDSGSPLFFLIDGEVVVLGTHYTAIGAPLISAYYTEVNAAMTTLGGGYQLTPIDLSEYPYYGI